MSDRGNPPQPFGHLPPELASDHIFEDTGRSQRRLLGLLLLALLLLKLRANSGVSDYGLDGAYYVEVARHVRDGLGLTSNVSLYHSGFPALPWPTPIYPLWPLLLGVLARLLPLSLLATWLPTACYLLTLWLGARVANRLWPAPLLPDLWPAFQGGHLLVLVLGLNPWFFLYTSKPYTEGLAMVLQMGMLWRCLPLFRRPDLRCGVEMGLWCGALFLCRSQMVVTTLAVLTTLVGVAFLGPLPARGRAALLGAMLSAGALYGLHAWRLSTLFQPFSWAMLLDFQAFRATPALSPVDLLTTHAGPMALLLDRLQGFGVAYQEDGAFSYQRSFGLLHWAPVLAALPLGVAAVRSRAWTAVRDPESWPWLFLGVFSLGWFLSLHAIHKPNFAAWNFGTRHGIPCVFLFLCATVVLFHLGRGWRLAALFLVSVSLYQGFGRTREEASLLRKNTPDTAENRAFAAWAPPGLVVAMPEPQGVAARTEAVGYHWVGEATTLDDLRVMFSKLSVTRLCSRHDDVLPLLSDPAFPRHFAPAEAPAGWSCYRAAEAP